MITTFLQQSLVEGDAPHAFWVLASSLSIKAISMPVRRRPISVNA
jgi:hypothetical protein